MREVVACVHPVGIHSAQVLDLQLYQRTSELCRVTQLLCEVIGLELISSAEDVHQKFDDCIHRGESVGKEDKANYDRILVVKPK